MKKYFFIISILTCSCTMSKERMIRECKNNIIEAYRCMAQKQRDSAFYYSGKADAFYEAAYNEKVNK